MDANGPALGSMRSHPKRDSAQPGLLSLLLNVLDPQGAGRGWSWGWFPWVALGLPVLCKALHSDSAPGTWPLRQQVGMSNESDTQACKALPSTASVVVKFT